MQAKQVDKDNRMVSHIVSLVLGIISLCTGFFWYIALPTSITAIVLGTKSYKKYGKKMGLAGMITGIVGLSITVLLYILFIFIIILQNGYL